MARCLILSLCLALQGCYGYAHAYIATHPDGVAPINTCCCER